MKRPTAGLIFSSNGGVREAPDEVMWEYR
jgi:hypothetical protein